MSTLSEQWGPTIKATVVFGTHLLRFRPNHSGTWLSEVKAVAPQEFRNFRSDGNDDVIFKGDDRTLKNILKAVKDRINYTPTFGVWKSADELLP